MSFSVYEWHGGGVTNWGDLLSLPLLRRFAGLTDAYETAQPENADVIAVGSVLGHMPPNWEGHVLGAGKLRPADTVPRNAKVWGVRGPLTAEGLHGWQVRPGRLVIGDPGLIADELVPATPRVHRLGILPHWSDTVLETRREFLRYDPLIINPRREPLSVIAEIASCEKLVTSSLHGMIVADSLGIPRRFEMATQLGAEGGTFKHEDYSRSIAADFQVGVTMSPNRHVVNDVRDRLFDMFEEFGGIE